MVTLREQQGNAYGTALKFSSAPWNSRATDRVPSGGVAVDALVATPLLGGSILAATPTVHFTTTVLPIS